MFRDKYGKSVNHNSHTCCIIRISSNILFVYSCFKVKCYSTSCSSVFLSIVHNVNIRSFLSDWYIFITYSDDAHFASFFTYIMYSCHYISKTRHLNCFMQCFSMFTDIILFCNNRIHWTMFTYCVYLLFSISQWRHDTEYNTKHPLQQFLNVCCYRTDLTVTCLSLINNLLWTIASLFLACFRQIYKENNHPQSFSIIHARKVNQIGHSCTWNTSVTVN